MATRVAILAYLRWREANLARLHDYSDERKATINEYMEDEGRFPKSLAMEGEEAPETAALPAAPATPEADTALPYATTPDAGAQALPAPAPENRMPFPDRKKMSGKDLWNGSFKAEIAPQVAADALVTELQKSGCDSLSAESIAFIEAQIKTGPQSQIENYAVGAYLFCKAMWDESIPYFKAAAAGEQHRTPYYVSLIQALQLRQRYEETLPVLDAAVANTQPANQYTALRIISLVGLKRTEEAEKLAAECRASEDRSVGTACMSAIGKTYDGEALPPPEADGTAGTASDSPFDFLRKLTGAPPATTDGTKAEPGKPETE